MNSRFTEIGRIARPRGLDGVVRFSPNENFDADLLDTLNIVYIRNERSDLIPIRIESSYKEVKRNQPVFFVKFDMIADRTEADNAMGKAVFTDQVLEVDDNAFDQPEELTGYDVFFDEEKFGTVLDTLSNPAHPILEVKRDIGTILVPMVDEFIAAIHHENRTVTCKNLDQLID